MFPAALSSMSSGFNAMSAVVLEDYCKPLFKKGISERESVIIMRSTVGVLGLLSVALVYVVQNLGSVLQMSMSLPATCMGSLFGSFLIGMFLPWIGKQATFYGGILGSINMIYIVTMTQIDVVKGLVRFDTKETSVEGCTYNFTAKESILTPTIDYDKQFHHISYLYYMPLGAMTTCASAFLLSFIFGFEDPCKVDLRLLAPVVRKFFNSAAMTKEADSKAENVLLFEMKDLQNR